jgi:hypothetical protein
MPRPGDGGRKGKSPMAEAPIVSDADETSYTRRLEDEARKRERGTYPRTLFIGLGGSGARALMHLRHLVIERFGALQNLEGIAYLSIDTSAGEEMEGPLEAVSFAMDERIRVAVDLKSYVGPNLIHHPEIRDWWDEEAMTGLRLDLAAGSGQIRQLARLAFFANREVIEAGIARAYRKVTSLNMRGSRLDTASRVRIVVVASLAGGTGSGMLLDLGALLKEQLGRVEAPSLEAFLLLPGVFRLIERGNNYSTPAANGYAALREVNHYLDHPFITRWDAQSPPVELRGLYEKHVLFSGTNASNEHLGDIEDCFRAIGEILFLDLSAGPMSGWIQAVRVNRQQYLRSAVTTTYRLPQPDGGIIEIYSDQWRAAFSSAGVSKLVFPSWRLLNQCSYEMAAQIVTLMDPGRFSQPADVLNAHRDRFIFDCGFFQGDFIAAAGSQAQMQVRDRLVRHINPGLAIDSVYEHIQRYQAELVGMAGSMYAERNTVEAGNEVWKKLAGLWGDAYSPGNEGDWPRQIRENSRALAKEVHDRLPEVLEEFRRKPAVGLSGVIELLKGTLELLERPAGQARYADWFREQRSVLRQKMDESQVTWAEGLKNAKPAERGFGNRRDNHKRALEAAADALGDYWRACVNEYIGDQAVEALKGIRSSVLEQLGSLEAISDRIRALESRYRSIADLYAAPQRSYIVHELALPAKLGDLLEPYLGRQPDERNERLQRLLDRSLRQMGLDTLAQIGETLSRTPDQFRDHLAALVFDALRGQDGRTAAFVEDSEDAVPGFIEQYPIFRILKEFYSASERGEMFDQLYRKGLPWVQPDRSEASGDFRPHGDAFLGCTTEGYEDIAFEMTRRLEAGAMPPFQPRLVRAADPSEIILYTELSGFPVYYLSELADLRRHYDSLRNDPGRVAPLHLNQEDDQLEPLIPFNQAQLVSLRIAWQFFILAEILGLIRSARRRADDEVHLVYQWRRKMGAAEVQWHDLGTEGQAIERLMLTPDLRSRLQIDVQSETERFLALPAASLDHLIALADYYFFCIFPVRAERGVWSERAMSRGSMQNLVCSELRTQWRYDALRTETDPQRLEEDVKKVLSDLATWSKPAYRNRRQPVPDSIEVPPEQRVFEWGLIDQAAEAVRSFVARGLLPQARDGRGKPVVRYPRLAVDWAWFGGEEIEPQDTSMTIEMQRDVAATPALHAEADATPEPMSPKEILLLAFRLVAARRASPDLLLHLDAARLREAAEGLLSEKGLPDWAVDRLRAAAELLAREVPEALPDLLWQGWMLATQRQALLDLASAAASSPPV